MKLYWYSVVPTVQWDDPSLISPNKVHYRLATVPPKIDLLFMANGWKWYNRRPSLVHRHYCGSGFGGLIN